MVVKDEDHVEGASPKFSNEKLSMEDGAGVASSPSVLEGTTSPSLPRPPVAPSGVNLSPSSTYISSGLAPSLTVSGRPSVNVVYSLGSDAGERRTIDSDQTNIRKDSDDVSLSNIKPVHNFFSQQQQYGYDSDGSDGSLVFSPASFDDQKPTAPRVGSSNKGDAARRQDLSLPANRDRTLSTDSNGSIRYINKSSQKQPAVPSQPSNPQMLPYHERRKLMQQKQQHEQFEQTQRQLQVQYQYQAAMLMQAQQAAQMQQQQQQQMSRNQPVQPQAPPLAAQAYVIDPRMVAGYYQMYGVLPPTQTPGMYPPTHSHHDSSSTSGYPHSPPSTYVALSPPMQPAQLQLPEQHHHIRSLGSGMAPFVAYQPTYQGFPMAVPYGFTPNSVAHPPSLQTEQPVNEGSMMLTEPLHTSSKTIKSRQRRRAESLSTTGATATSASNVTRIKNPPRPPTKPSKQSHPMTNSTGSIPPPAPPLAQNKASNKSAGGHCRADSYGSMSSLGSHGPGGISASSFSRDDEDEAPPPPHIPKAKPPPTPQTTKPPPQALSSSSKQKQPTSNSKKNPAAAAAAAPIASLMKQPIVDTEDKWTQESSPQVSHVRKHSFLDRIRLNWSPQSRDSPSGTTRKKPNIEDFHRHNQEFLQRSTVLSTFYAPSSELPHKRVGSQDRPPASRGTHRRLTSISNHEWDDTSDNNNTSDDEKDLDASASAQKKAPPSASLPSNEAGTSEDTSESGSYFNDIGYTDSDSVEDPDETTSLLPPSGISSKENDEIDLKYGRGGRYSNQNYAAPTNERRNQRNLSRGPLPKLSPTSASHTRRFASDDALAEHVQKCESQIRKGKKKKYRRRNSKQRPRSDSTDSDHRSSEDNQVLDYRQWTKKRQKMLEKERSKYVEQWKAEARAEAELRRQQESSNHFHRRCRRSIETKFQKLGYKSFRLMTHLEAFIGNLPLTICAVAMAIVTLGVVWFKFAEELLDTCEPVRFHSTQCTFPEFPGCFYCDTSAIGYKIAVGFHYGCKVVSGFLALLVVAKILLATRVVIDEMSSPTTSSPAGLLCMTSVCVFAGRGLVGQIVVSSAACVHLCLAIWFIYMALAYHIMPEVSLRIVSSLRTVSTLVQEILHFLTVPVVAKLVSQYSWDWYQRCENLVVLPDAGSLVDGDIAFSDFFLFPN
jgi:hypothetical protein